MKFLDLNLVASPSDDFSSTFVSLSFSYVSYLFRWGFSTFRRLIRWCWFVEYVFYYYIRLFSWLRYSGILIDSRSASFAIIRTEFLFSLTFSFSISTASLSIFESADTLRADLFFLRLGQLIQFYNRFIFHWIIHHS